LRAGLDALRGLLDTTPSTARAIEATVTGDPEPLKAQIAVFAQVWRQQEKPNLNFSPREFEAWAGAAVMLLRQIDQHLVPLLSSLNPLMPHSDDD
jgi:hypothetical protein